MQWRALIIQQVLRINRWRGFVPEFEGVGELSARQPLANALYELRNTWAQVVNNLRGFLAYRDQKFITNLHTYLEQNGVALKRVRSPAALPARRRGFLAGGVLTALLVAWMMGRSIG